MSQDGSRSKKIFAVKIRSGDRTLKDWFGGSLEEETQLVDLFAEYASEYATRRGLPSVPDTRSCIGSLSALGPVHDLIDSKQRRGAINQWVCYGGYRGFDITVFDI